jgi:O-antigen/teichoic acid export membrane protein
MRLSKLTGLTNLVLRSLTLGLRFVLSFYIVKYLGFEANGIYGLAAGAVGSLPGALGWGLNYFTAREVIGLPPKLAVARIRDRLVVTLCSLTAASVVATAIALFGGYSVTYIYVLIAALVWLETLALDLHMPLVCLGKATEANTLAFIRLASWVPPIVILGLLVPGSRTIGAVFLAWAIANLLALGVLLYVSREWDLRESLRTPVDFKWIRLRLSRSWHIYLSDLGLIGLTYLDRYIVSFLLGLSATGIYTFFWSLTNALQTLVATSVVQIALPVLVSTFKSGSSQAWRSALQREFLKTIVTSTLLAVAIFVVSEILLRYLGMLELREHRVLFLAMLGAAVLRSCSDLANIGITSTGGDKSYAAINVSGVLLSAALSFAGSYWFGLTGTAFASLATAIILLAVRLFYFARAFKAQSSPVTEIHSREQ